MTLFSISFVYLSFYCIALFLAIWRTRAGNPPKSRNCVAAMIIGAVGIQLIYVSSLLSPQGAAPLVLVAALVLVPVFLLGLGGMVGIWIATWRRQLTVQIALAALAIGVPLLAFLGFDTRNNAMTNRAAMAFSAQQEALAAFQKTNVTGRLGRYPITLPASPQIDTLYTCFDAESGTVGQCRADFGVDAGLPQTPGDVPIFHYIHIARKSQGCTVACISFERLGQWCQSRSDVTLQEWCKREPADEIELSYDENRVPNEANDAGWTTPTANFGQVEVKCRAFGDAQTCRVRYDIERNLQVTIWMREVSDSTIAARLEAAQNYVSRLWTALQRNT